MSCPQICGSCDVSTGAEWKVGILQASTRVADSETWERFGGWNSKGLTFMHTVDVAAGNGRLKSCAGSQLGCLMPGELS